VSRDDERQHAQAPPAPRWGLGDVVVGLVAGLALSSLAANIWIGATGDEELNLPGKGLAQLGLWLGLAGTAILACRRKGSGQLDIDFGLRARRIDVVVGVAAGVVAHQLLLPGVALLMRPLVGRPKVSGPAEDLFNSAHGVGLVGLLLFVVVGAPLVEELFFRGLLLRSLQRRTGTGAAVVLDGVVFGLAHPQALAFRALVLVMVSLAVLGLVFAGLVVRMGRLGPSIVAHATFNGLTATFLLT
jgi:uncharacterized protein